MTAPLQINHDLHMHTYLSTCCRDKEKHRPANILARAEELGITTIGFADHIWTNRAVPTSPAYETMREEQITRLRADLAPVSTTVRVLVGCEADTAAPGRFSITPDFLDQVDFVLLSCTHVHLSDIIAQPKSDRPRDIAEHMLAMHRSAAESGLATAIPHPFRFKNYMDRYDATIASISDAEFLDVFARTAECGVALEISPVFLPPAPEGGRPAWSLETPLRFLALARQAGCKFVFGSDAHYFRDVGAVRRIRPIVDALGLTADDLAAIVRT